MEIFAFLNLSRRRIVLLAVAVLYGAAVGGWVAARTPATYEAKGTINVASVFTPGRPAYEANQFTVDLKSTLQRESTAAAVAEELGLSKSDITDNLQVIEPGDNMVPLRFTSDQPEVASIVVRQVALEGLRKLADENLTRARTAADQAAAELAAASAAMDEFQKRTGWGYELAKGVSTLRLVDIPEAEAAVVAAETAGERAEAEARLASLRAELDAARALLPEYYPIARALDAAGGRRTDADRDLSDAVAAQQVALRPGDALTVEEPSPTSRTPVLARGAIGGGVAAAVVVLAALLLSDAVRRRRGRRKGAGAEGGEGPSSDPGATTGVVGEPEFDGSPDDDDLAATVEGGDDIDEDTVDEDTVDSESETETV